MKIELHLYASLGKYRTDQMIQNDQMIEIEEGTTIRTVLADFEIPAGEVKLVFVNGTRAGIETVLKNDDRLGLFPPVGGG